MLSKSINVVENMKLFFPFKIPPNTICEREGALLDAIK